MEPRSEEQMADRHAVASGEKERHHDENRMRNIYVGQRGSETVNEEQPDKLRKIVRLEQEAPNRSSSNHACLLHVLRVVRDKTDQSLYLCTIQVMSMTYKFLRSMFFYEMYGRKTRYIKEVLDGYREEDCKRSQEK